MALLKHWRLSTATCYERQYDRMKSSIRKWWKHPSGNTQNSIVDDVPNRSPCSHQWPSVVNVTIKDYYEVSMEYIANRTDAGIS